MDPLVQQALKEKNTVRAIGAKEKKIQHRIQVWPHYKGGGENKEHHEHVYEHCVGETAIQYQNTKDT